jgi:hypothetical protein
MASEEPSQQSEQSWNEQLKEWYIKQGTMRERGKIAKKYGLTADEVGRYTRGDASKLDKISATTRVKLYRMTGLDFFREGLPDYLFKDEEKPKQERKQAYHDSDLSQIARIAKQGIDKIVEQTTSQLSGGQKLELGLLKSQSYKPSAEQRADAVIQLLDILAEEIDYYRAASENERQVLVDRLQKDPESFGYITQMLNVIYQGKQIDSWMMMVQPPSKTKRILRGGK